MLDGMPAVKVKTELLESEQGVSVSLPFFSIPLRYSCLLNPWGSTPRLPFPVGWMIVAQMGAILHPVSSHLQCHLVE